MKHFYIQKLSIVLVFSLLSAILLGLTACENPFIDGALQPKKITFISNGGTEVPDQVVYRGAKINKPADPEKEDNEFLGWFTDNNYFINEWNFSVVPERDLTLYAKWSDFYAASIYDVSINIEIPVKSVVPNTTAEIPSGGNYTASAVSWNPAHNPFLGGQQYTATVVLTAINNFVFAQSDFNAVINNSLTASVLNNTGSTVTLSYAFPATLNKNVESVTITSQPSKMNYIHGDELDLSGFTVTLVYSDGTSDANVTPADFGVKGIYTSVAHGAVLSYSGAYNNQRITITAGGVEAKTTADLVISLRPISSAALSVIAPVIGQIPSMIAGAGAGGNYSVGTVSWYPADVLFLGEVIYTVSITITANDCFTFTGGLTTAIIDGQNADVVNNGSTAVLSFSFPKTNNKTVSSISIASQPAKLNYVHGEALNLGGLSVTLGYNDTSTEVVPFSQFPLYNITATPEAGSTLSRTENSDSVKLVYNASSITTATNFLVISKAPGAAVTPGNPFFVGGSSYSANPPAAPSTGQSIEYAVSTNAAAALSELTWQTSAVFSIASPSAGTYYWYARSAENNDYLAGAHGKSLAGVNFYTVTFDSAGGSFTPSLQIIRSGQQAAAPASNPTRAGFGFYGWLNGAAAWNFASDTVNSNTILTADWRANQIFSIGFDLINNLAPDIPTGLSFSRSGAAGQQTAITINLPAPPAGQAYTNIKWEHDGHILSNTASVELSKDDIRVNLAGSGKIITLTLSVNGVPYSKNVMFDVVQ